MFAALFKRVEAVAARRRRAVIARLMQSPLPPGVSASQGGDGVVLSGRKLRHRFITDVRLRSFGK